MQKLDILNLGKINFLNILSFLNKRVDNGGTVHVSLGKAYFTKDQILKNLKSLMEELYAKKPANIRGSFVLATYLSTTMGPSFRVDPTAIDPKAKSYLLKNY